MKIIFHKNFEKQYKKLPKNIKLKVKERNVLFTENPYNPLLNNHALNGKYIGYRSINITGNIRATYKFISENIVLFTEVGTHSELYGK